jgi:hypothetical protein
MKILTFRRYGIPPVLLLILGVLCAVPNPASAQAGTYCGLPLYPNAIVKRKGPPLRDHNEAFTDDRAENVVAWYKQHLPGTHLTPQPGGALFDRVVGGHYEWLVNVTTSNKTGHVVILLDCYRH